MIDCEFLPGSHIRGALAEERDEGRPNDRFDDVRNRPGVRSGRSLPVELSAGGVLDINCPQRYVS